VKSARGKYRRATKPQLLTREQLDGRTNAAKVFDRLVSDIEGDAHRLRRVTCECPTDTLSRTAAEWLAA
jgi:hypothetical protein